MISLFVTAIVGLVFGIVALTLVGCVLVGIAVLPFMILAQLGPFARRMTGYAGRGIASAALLGLLAFGTIGFVKVLRMESRAVYASVEQPTMSVMFSTDEQGDQHDFVYGNSHIVISSRSKRYESSETDETVCLLQQDDSGDAEHVSDRSDSHDKAETDMETLAEDPSAVTSFGAEKPAWIARGDFQDGHTANYVVKGEFQNTKLAAELSMLEIAAAAIRKDFAAHTDMPANTGSWKIPLDMIDEQTVASRHYEIEPTKFPHGLVNMHRVTAQIAITPEMRSQLQDVWRPQIVGRRIKVLGTGLGFVALLVVSFSTYLHIDQRTNGRMRGRLRLGLAMVLLGVGMGMSTQMESLQPILKELTEANGAQTDSPVSADVSSGALR